MKAMYCGSFDPLTNGHLDIIRRTMMKYREVIINVGMNPDKKSMFDIQTRIAMIKDAVETFPRSAKIDVIADSRLTVDIAMQHDVTVLVRGIRQGTSDLAEERNLAKINSCLAKTRGHFLSTEFVSQTDPLLNVVSSTMVKKLCALRQFITVALCVPKNVHQMLMNVYLFEIWTKCFVCNAGGYWKYLTEAYNERPYHNLSHLGYMMNMLQIYIDQTGGINGREHEMREVELAILLHDYVHNAQKDGNFTDAAEHSDEQASADFIENIKSCLVSSLSVSKVQSLIMATAHHGEPKDELHALIADLDLSIFGTTEKWMWKNYTEAVREEYGTYPDKVYIPERIKVLDGFLQKERIFHTDFFHQMLEHQARKNLAEEIDRLKSL